MKVNSSLLGMVYLMASLFLLNACSQSSHSSTTSSHTIVHATDQIYLKACEQDKANCTPVTLKRNSPNDQVQVTLPASSLHTTALLFDVINNNIFKTKGVDKAKALKTINSFNKSPLTLEMTGLPDGQYHVQLLTCSTESGFQVNLKTSQGNASMSSMSF